MRLTSERLIFAFLSIYDVFSSFADDSLADDFVIEFLRVRLHAMYEFCMVVAYGLSGREVYKRNMPLLCCSEFGDVGSVQDGVMLAGYFDGDGGVCSFDQ